MKPTLSIKRLVGTWKHAHEEDAQGFSVFRPANGPFAPSRGRLSFELHADGNAVYEGLGAADASTSEAARWQISPDNRLTICRDSKAIFKADVVSVAKAKLVLKIQPSN